MNLIWFSAKIIIITALVNFLNATDSQLYEREITKSGKYQVNKIFEISENSKIYFNKLLIRRKRNVLNNWSLQSEQINDGNDSRSNRFNNGNQNQIGQRFGHGYRFDNALNNMIGFMQNQNDSFFQNTANLNQFNKSQNNQFPNVNANQQAFGNNLNQNQNIQGFGHGFRFESSLQPDNGFASNQRSNNLPTSPNTGENFQSNSFQNNQFPTATRNAETLRQNTNNFIQNQNIEGFGHGFRFENSLNNNNGLPQNQQNYLPPTGNTETGSNQFQTNNQQTVATNTGLSRSFNFNTLNLSPNKIVIHF